MIAKKYLLLLLIPSIFLFSILMVSVPVQGRPRDLLVQSTPIVGIDFTLDSTTYTTNWTDSLSSGGTYNVTMPSIWMVGAVQWDFVEWENGSTNPVRVFVMPNEPDVTFIATYQVHPEFAPPWVKMYVNPTLYPFVAPGGGGASRFPINITLETTIPNNDPTGIVAWGIYFRVNPASLRLGRVRGALPGYFIYDWSDDEFLDPPTVYSNLVASTGFADVSEFATSPPAWGAGDTYSGLKMIAIEVESLSDTIPSLLDIYNAEYMTPDGNWHQVDIIIDGYYGAAPGFQSAVGSGPIPIDLTNPVGTTWHELYPNYSNMWELTDWTDNTDGVLSASDQIDMLNASGWIYPFHVDAVTTTIHWTFKPDDVNPTGENASAEPDESYPSRVDGFMSNPVGSIWHQIYPDYSEQFKITSWEDNTPGDPGTPNGVFDPSDQFDFIYEHDPDTTHWAHLDAVSTDIIISQKGDPWEPTPEFPLGVVLMIAIAPAIPIVYLWRLRKKVVAK